MSTQSNSKNPIFSATPDKEEVIDIILTETVRKIDNSAIPLRNADDDILDLITKSSVGASQKLAIDYLSGIIATSAKAAGSSDAELRLANEVIKLHETELLLHKVIYTYATSLTASQLTANREPDTTPYRVAIPFDALFAQLSLNEAQPSQAVEILVDSLEKLQAKGFIDRSSVGDIEALQDLVPNTNHPGIAIQLSDSGLELFSWSLGKGHLGLAHIFKKNSIF